MTRFLAKTAVTGAFLGLFVSACRPAGRLPSSTGPVRVSRPLTNDGSWILKASSVESPELGPKQAADGDPTTRWSSEFQDHQWWQVDFGSPQVVEGIAIQWEDAYARDYRVSVSAGGHEWITLFARTNWNGGSDVATFEPVTTRLVRIDCLRRATQWGFSIYEVRFNSFEPARPDAFASSGSGEFAPRFAIDGDRRTRWSSNFSDDEWWAVDFGRSRKICGLNIFWETAFGEKYTVDISDDGRKWQTVYRVNEGDGNTDRLFFGPVSTRYLRIRGIQRGTGWGYSIWELDVLEPPRCPRAWASDEISGHPARHAVDGLTSTWWQSSGPAEYLVVELPSVTELGGVEILWGPVWPKHYAVSVSRDLANWIRVAARRNGNGGRDLIYFRRKSARAVRIEGLSPGGTTGCAVARVELKSGEEQAEPLKEYQALAADRPRGMFPRWLLREQEYWTITGIPADPEETLLGETGCVEPRKGSFCIQPFVRWGGTLYTWADVAREVGLYDGFLPLPWVQWKLPGGELLIRPVSVGEPGRSATLVQYRLSTPAAQPVDAELILALRPIQLNPVWQRGGFSPIRKAELQADTNALQVRVNGSEAVRAVPSPAFAWARGLDAGEVCDAILSRRYDCNAEASDPQGRVSIAFVWSIALSRESPLEVTIALPLHGPEGTPFGEMVGEFDQVRRREAGRWRRILSGLDIRIPDMRLIRILQSNLAYILINQDGPWIKPGPRNYNHAWIRDGALTSTALLRAGIVAPVANYARAYSRMVRGDGWVPFIILEDGQPVSFNPDLDRGEGHEFDSQGEYVYLVGQLAAVSGGEGVSSGMVEKAVRAVRFIEKLRRLRLEGKYRSRPDLAPYFGILPASNSHEGYYPARHSYWDDFWAVRGIGEAIRICRRFGRAAEEKEFQQLRREMVAAVRRSIQEVMRRAAIRYVPGCVELADNDPTSTAIAVNLGVGEAIPPDALRSTFTDYYQSLRPFTRGTKRRTYTPYEIRNVEALVRLGMRQEALEVLRYLVADAVFPPAWNHMAEVVHARRRAPSYIGDMPHTWVGSGYINAVLSLLAYEEDDRIILCAGIDPDWVEKTSAGVAFRLQTTYGAVAGEITCRDEGIRLHFEGEADPPNGFQVALPRRWRGYRVQAQRGGAASAGAGISFAELPFDCLLLPPGADRVDGTTPLPRESGIVSGRSDAWR